MIEWMHLLGNGATIAFVLSNMIAMGLSLTLPQIVAPLRTPRLVGMALLASFVVAPLLAQLLIRFVPLGVGSVIGMTIISTAAGAPFLPKLAQIARGDVAFSVGLMVLLQVSTVLCMPVVLPMLLPGAAVCMWAIAKPLLFLMLMPLGLALLLRARRARLAAALQPWFAKVSTLALMVLLVALIVANFSEMIAFAGSGGIIALPAFIVGNFVTGYALGGNKDPIRSVLGLGTAQRSMAASLVVATTNFTNPEVAITIVVGSLAMLILLLSAAALLARRNVATHLEG